MTQLKMGKTKHPIVYSLIRLHPFGKRKSLFSFKFNLDSNGRFLLLGGVGKAYFYFRLAEDVLPHIEESVIIHVLVVVMESGCEL